MSTEVRPIESEAEQERHAFISNYAFNSDRGDESVARRARYYDRDWLLGAFDAGEIVAGLVVIPYRQYINGASIAMGGIASVSCLPERRREGHVDALLRSSLELMRDAGQSLSALWTPHYSLYRRFGWEISSRLISYAFPPKQMKLRQTAPHGGIRRVEPDDWPALQAIYEAQYAKRNGALVRTEHRWRNHIFSDYGKGQRDAAVWSNAAGEPRGYVVYHTTHRMAPGSPFPDTILRVDDWAALDADAYTAVLGYLLSHDLSDSIVMLAGQDEPFAEAFDEPTHISGPPGAWFGPMLRLVDLARAIEARPALSQASGKGVTLAVADATAPWNAGTWRIESSEGLMSAERTSADAGGSLDARTLAAIYNGFIKASDAARVGSLQVHDEDVLQTMDDLFAVSYSPYCPDDF